jgi:hypothetical protein
MMYVKGEIVKNLPIFIKEKFGAQRLFKWKHSLSWQAVGIYGFEIKADEWYPLKIALSEPVNTLCKLYYHNSLHGAIEYGWFLAEYEHGKRRSLFSSRINTNSHSPLNNACDKLKSYYKSPDVIPISINEYSAIIQVNNFPQKDITDVIIAGWLQRMIKRDNDIDADIEIRAPLKNGSIEYSLKWNIGRSDSLQRMRSND